MQAFFHVSQCFSLLLPDFSLYIPISQLINDLSRYLYYLCTKLKSEQGVTVAVATKISHGV